MKRKRSFLFSIPAALLSLILCWSLTRALMIVIPQKREDSAFETLKQSVQPPAKTREPSAGDAPAATEAEADGEAAEYPYAPLAEVNADFVGWLSVADTEIDYPVMKPPEDDPERYLRRDFYGRPSLSGCLFIGALCNADSEAFIIYGHNMNTGTMFGALDRYADYDYALSHPDIVFRVPDGERVYRVFAAFQTKVYAERDDVFKYYEAIGTLGRDEYGRTVDAVRSMSLPSLPFAPAYPQQLLFLSTCSYHTANGRFVVAAYRIA